VENGNVAGQIKVIKLVLSKNSFKGSVLINFYSNQLIKFSYIRTSYFIYKWAV